MFRILVVDDDARLRFLLVSALQKSGFEVFVAENGAEALEFHCASPVHLMVVDINMPVMDGFQLLKALRPRDQVPVLMLTAHKREHTRLQGFDLGADDYMCKPFNMFELIARVRAILKRSSTSPEKHSLRSGPFLVNRLGQEVLRDGVKVGLLPAEYHILEALVSHPGQSLTRDQILRLVWPCDDHPLPRTVDVHILRLRRKLTVEGDPTWIVSSRAKGYIWGHPIQEDSGG